METAACLAFCMILSAAANAPGASPHRPDSQTVLLLHLDGDAADAGPCGNNGEEKGELSWAPGRFGQALSLDGKGGIVIRASRSLAPGDGSWTVECSLKPLPEQPAHSAVVSAVPGHGRRYGIGIVYGKQLGASFGADDGHGAYVNSGDLAARLFDGQWHHAAAVRDMDRNGEVRLYLDGEEVGVEQAAVPWPIASEGGTMPVTLGAAAPWYVGKDGYRGLIDEVRISNVVRPEYAARPGAPAPPPKPTVPVPPEARLSPDDPASTRPLALEPGSTLIAIPELIPFNTDFESARLLQEHLRDACGATEGFEIVRGGQVAEVGERAVLALGRTRWLADGDLDGLHRDGFVLRRRGNVVAIAGARSGATLYAAAAFLDRFCGVRFYMPGELFTSRPAELPITLGRIDLRVEPYVRVGAAYTWGVPAGSDWMRLHALDRRPISHQHTMNERFPPEKFAEKYPEIYPVIDGERYIPKPGDQRWQPCFSEPRLVDAAVESAAGFFAERPEVEYVTFSIQDSHAHCERDLASDEVKQHGEVQGLSNLYWTFMNRTAERLEKQFPDKRVVGIVYGNVRMPPPFKLHPNIIAWMVFKMSDVIIDRRFTEREDGTNYEKAWAEAASAVGHHDWTYGHGFLIPRIYTDYVQRTFLEFERLGAPIRCAYAEPGPNWGLDGPKLYLMARLWWDPHIDVKAVRKQFCDDMFGAASGEMLAYFTKLETLYDLMNRDQERKLFRWNTQFLQDDEERALTRECRAHLDHALTATRSELVNERVGLFSKSFRLSEYFFELANAEAVSPQQVEEVRRYVREVIAPDSMTFFRRTGPDDIIKEVDQALNAVTRGKPAQRTDNGGAATAEEP